MVDLFSVFEPSSPTIIYHEDRQLPEITVAAVPISLPTNRLIKDDQTDLYRIAESELKSVANNYEQAIISSAEIGANIVCFNELSYPYSKTIRWNKIFSRKLQRLSKEYSIYISAGSYHDFIGTKQNISLFYSPFRKEPYHHIKYQGAIYERIRPPETRIVNIVCSPFGNICTLICFDMDDTNSKNKLHRRNFNEHKKFKEVDIVLVPAFDNSNGQKIKNHCQHLSKAMSSVVIFINEPECENGPPSFFYGGKEKRMKRIKKKKRDASVVYQCKINMGELRNQRLGTVKVID